MRAHGLIIFALLGLAGFPARGGVTNGPPETSCRTCHVADRPTHGQADLTPCPRIKSAGARPVSEGPKSIALNTNGVHYGPVTFSHQTHAGMTAMGGGCSTCHHEATEGEPIRRCDTCHARTRLRTELDRPDLRGALHRQCTGCHAEWEAEGRCASCHQPRSGPPPARAARIQQPRQLIFETASTNGALATFYHADHVKTFKLACAACHTRAACADCHAQEKMGQAADRRIAVPAKPKVDHARCVACHRDDACARCHADAALSPFSHKDKGIELDSDHADAACTDCHEKANFHTPPACAGCHDDKAYPRDLPGKRTAGAVPPVPRGAP